MKKTAVLIYDQFCTFEISTALEALALGGKPITVFAKTTSPVTSEDGLSVLPHQSIRDVDLDEYDSLLLPGAADIREAVEDADILAFIRGFSDAGKLIGAISIAPILLVKCGAMGTRPFMAGINREELAEEGFTEEDLAHMHGWNDNLKAPIPEGYIIADHIITSVSYEFARFGLAFARLLGIGISAGTFGIKE